MSLPTVLSHLPLSFVTPLLGTFPMDTIEYYAVTALAVDLGLRAWLDPFAKPAAHEYTGDGTLVAPTEEPFIAVTRRSPQTDGFGGVVVRGYLVDLTYAVGHRWMPVGERPETDGLPWPEVTEFVGFPPPSTANPVTE